MFKCSATLAHPADSARDFSFIWEPGVEVDIQLKHVDSGLSKQAELAPLSVVLDETSSLIFRNSTLPGNSRNLKLRCRGRDIGIKSGSRSCNQVNRHRLTGMIRLIAGCIHVDPINQALIGGAELGAVGIRGIVSVSRRGRPGVEIAGTDECLADDV